MTSSTPGGPHPLLRAVGLLVLDMLSTLGFVGLYAATHRIDLAMGVGVVLGLAEIGWQAAHGEPAHRMQWLSLFLVAVFGGATLVTGNPLFALIKPALIYGAVALVMLSPGWMNRYAPSVARGVDIARVNHAFGFVWAALFAGIAVAFLALALLESPATLAWFVVIVPIAGKTVLMGIRYAVTRRIVRRRLRIHAPLPLPASLAATPSSTG